MADYGVLDEGFVPQTAPVIRDEIDEGLRQKFGRSFPLGDYTFAGHVSGILSERLGLLWEVAEATYSAFDVDKNVGASQRAIGLLTGTFELEASYSVVLETLVGDDASVIPEGTIISQSLGKRFATVADVTLVQLPDWAALGNYAVDDRVNNATRSYICITAGVAAGAGGPTTNAADITDGTVHWKYLGEGEAVADVIVAAEEVGPTVAVAGDLTTIETPVGGLNTAVNLLDAVLGREEQSDEDFRLMREAELSQPGTGPPDAIRAALLALSGVTNATVFFNNTDTTDVNGLPPHSCECLVQGGADQDVWDTLWENVPVGIVTYGDEVGTVTDDEGTVQTLRFTRPDEKLVWATITLTKNPRSYIGDAAVKEAVALTGNERNTGYDVVASAISAWSFIDGVLDVTSVLISVSPVTVPVASTTIPISLRELAKFDTSRISIVSTDGTP